MKLQATVTRTVSYIILFCLLLWVAPNLVFITAAVSGASQQLLCLLGPLVPIGAGLNSGVNVFIYAMKHKEFRECMLKFFKMIKTSARTTQPQPIGPQAGESRTK